MRAYFNARNLIFHPIMYRHLDFHGILLIDPICFFHHYTFNALVIDVFWAKVTSE